MMKRYFYNAGPLMSKWLQKNTNYRRYQDQIFRNAIIAAARISQISQGAEIDSVFSELHNKILDMTIKQQNKYANNYHVECLFNHFSLMSKITESKQILYNQSSNSRHTKDIVDPDKFPIWDTKAYKRQLQSIWSFHLGKLRHQLGFELVVRESRVDHPEAGKGVKVELSRARQCIMPGQLLGFVPGVVYQDHNNYSKYRLKLLSKYEKIPEHLHFPSGKILEFQPIRAFESQSEDDTKVPGYYVNPYALGQFVNHPPPGIQENVYFTEILVDPSFLPMQWMKFLPYENFIDHSTKQLRMFGMFALKKIKNHEQLFVNYMENHIYPINGIPEWYLQPMRETNYFKYLVKGQYEYPTRGYWKWIEQKYLEKNRQQWQKYQQKATYHPGKVEYQTNQYSIRTMQSKNIARQNELFK